MDWNIIHIDETDSTNSWLKNMKISTASRQENVVVWADYQTAGRGCGTNTWESERGKNLLFSILLHPKEIPAIKQFHISMAVSLALCNVLDQHIGDVSIKWPNDIYWRNAKIAGIIIENRLQGQHIHDSIIGIGLNVNQQQFHSKAPNPISLWQIHGHETNREQLLKELLYHLEQYLGKDIKTLYLSRLYRRKGFHPYTDQEGVFMAELVNVEDDGHLVLCDESGKERQYAFKEVQFVL